MRHLRAGALYEGQTITLCGLDSLNAGALPVCDLLLKTKKDPVWPGYAVPEFSEGQPRFPKYPWVACVSSGTFFSRKSVGGDASTRVLSRA
jgi:hypothetical protein